MRIRNLTIIALVAAATAVPGVAGAHPPVGGTLHEFGEIVEYPMLFPVADGASYTYYWDTFWAGRSDGIHHAQDIMAPKMTPVIAPRDGTIGYVNWSSDAGDPRPNPDRCCNLTIEHDDGWSTWYIHLNNDTPGTDDGRAWGIAPGIRPGVRVSAGQVVGWVGDSGNAEDTGPHLHFELRDPEGTIVNPIDALDAAVHVNLGTCLGRAVTLAGSPGDDVITGTPGADVIAAGEGDDVVFGNGGNDVICGGPGSDVLSGGIGADRIAGGADDDHLLGGVGNDLLLGGGGSDLLVPGPGTDRAKGGIGHDRILAASDGDRVAGNTGRDTVDYSRTAMGVVVDLGLGEGRAAGADTLVSIENAIGSALADVIVGDGGRNVLRGNGGDDLLRGLGGDDLLLGGPGDDELDGGEGTDVCRLGTAVACE